MPKLEVLKLKEVLDAEHLKNFKKEDLQAVVDVLNSKWFEEPVSTKTKPALARAISELVIADGVFFSKYFKDNPEAKYEDLDDFVTDTTEFNSALPEELTDEEYEDQYQQTAMITPSEIEDSENNGMTDSILEIIKKLTGLDYLEIYGFNIEETDIKEQQKEIKVTDEKVGAEIEESILQEETEQETNELVDEELSKEQACPNTIGELGINTIDFQDALEIVAPGLGREENEDIIRFEKEYIRTYSSNISVLHQFTTGIEGSVKGKELVALAKKLPAQGLNISQTKEKLIIKGDADADAEFNFIGLMMPHIDVPGDNAVWESLPDDFSGRVGVAALSCSVKAQNPIYNCVVIEKDTVVACENGVRGFQVYMESEFDGKMIILGKLAKELVKYHPTEVCIDKAYFHFRNTRGTIISVRQYASGEFSKAFYDNLLHKGVEVEIPKGSKDLVERSGIIAGKGFRDYISVDIAKGKMVIKGRSETSCLTERIQLKNKDIEVSFAIQPVLFKEILGIANYMVICENYILFKGGDITCWISKTVPN